MLEELLERGWTYHDTESARLAAELEAAAPPDGDAMLDRFLHLSNHTIGEHLGDWRRACDVAERTLAGKTPSAQEARAWARLSAARAMSGDAVGAVEAETAAAAAVEHPFAMTIEARFLLVAVLVGAKRTREAAALYAACLALARRLGEDAPHRAIAVASNNLAWDLAESAPRSADEDRLMREAAETAHAHWTPIGTWSNAEKALALKARVAVLLNEPDEAITHADAGLAIIAANGPAPADVGILKATRAMALALKGDAAGRARELAEADAAAAAASPEGQAFYADQRAWIVGDRPAG